MVRSMIGKVLSILLLAFGISFSAYGFRISSVNPKGISISSFHLQATSKPYLSQSALVDVLATKTGFHKNDVNKVIEAFREVLKDQVLAQGDELRLKNFGTFKRKVITARKRRNIQTGEIFDSPEKHLVAFSPSSNLKVVPGAPSDE